jgi:hypothetical protein
LPVVTKAERVASSMSLVVRQVCALAASADQVINSPSSHFKMILR